MTHLRLSGALALLLATACGSSKPATTDTASQPEAAAQAGATEDAVAAGASEAAKTSPPEDPKEKPSETKPAEAPKEDNALVLELAIRGKDLDDAGKSAMEKEAREIIQKSAKLALSDKGIKAPRHVIATITADPLAGDKKGFSVKLGMTGVTKNGSCPLFDLNQKLSMEGGKKDNAADVAQLRSAALAALLSELEQKSPTLKPNANCTPYK